MHCLLLTTTTHSKTNIHTNIFPYLIFFFWRSDKFPHFFLSDFWPWGPNVDLWPHSKSVTVRIISTGGLHNVLCREETLAKWSVGQAEAEGRQLALKVTGLELRHNDSQRNEESAAKLRACLVREFKRCHVRSRGEQAKQKKNKTGVRCEPQRHPLAHWALLLFARSAASRAAMFWEAVTRCRRLIPDLSREMIPQRPCSQ